MPSEGPASTAASPTLAQRLVPAIARARAGARRGLDALDRLLHPVRRRAARRIVRSIKDPHRVLVMCYGNVCRSPFAAAVLSQRLAANGRSDVLVESAGFIGPGRMPPRLALDASHRRKIDLSSHMSAIVKPEQVREASLIIVMSKDQAARVREVYYTRVPIVMLGDLDPHGIRTRLIVDPWDGGPADFEFCYDRIERCAQALVTELGRGNRTSRAPLVRMQS